MKGRFGIALIIVATVAAFVMTRRNFEATTTEPGTVTIRVAHFTLDPPFRTFLTKAGEAYEKLHPGVRIKQLDIPRQVYLQWQRTQIVGDMAPEIMQFAYFNPGVEDMVMHRFVVLDDWVEKPNPYGDENAVVWRDTFLDGLNSRDTYNEKLRAYFGIPLIMGGYRFFYNETMSEKRLGGEKAWDFQEFKALPDRLEDPAVADEDRARVMPMASSTYSSYSWFKMLFGSVTQEKLFSLDRNYDLQISGRDTVMGFLEGQWNYHTEDVQVGLKLMRDASQLMNPGFTQIQKPEGNMEFSQRRSFGVSGAHVDLTYLREMAAFEIGEASFPVPDQSDPVYGDYVLGPVSELAGDSSLTLGVLRSPVQEQAIDFLQFLTSDEMMALLREETGWRVSTKGNDKAATANLKPGYPAVTYDFMNNRGNIMAWRQNFYRLFQREGGVADFAERMDADSPAEMRVWLKSQATTLRQTLRQQEMAIISRWALAKDRQNGQREDPALAGFLQVNNRQEAEYRRIERFRSAHVD